MIIALFQAREARDLRMAREQWVQKGERPPAPPAVSGTAMAGRTEEGVHDR